MELHLAVCDDEPVQIAFLTDLIRTWASRCHRAVRVDGFPSAESFLFRYAADKSFDILLLDVEMGGMNGVELARTIRRENRELQIIFVTGYLEYITDGYDVEALNYLLKPVTEEKLLAVLERAAERLGRRESALLLETGDETVRLPLYEIRYLEVRQNYVTVHAAEEYTVKRPLSELEQGLDDSFFRTGRSFIVNLRYVKKVSRTEVFLKDGASVPLSRGLYDRINQAIIRYF